MVCGEEFGRPRTVVWGADGDGEASGEVTDGRVIVSSVDDGGADLLAAGLFKFATSTSQPPSLPHTTSHTHTDTQKHTYTLTSCHERFV